MVNERGEKKLGSYLKMSAEAIMTVYLKNWTWDQSQQIGIVGNTVWSVQMAHIYDGRKELQLIRNHSVENTKVEITAELRFGTILFISERNQFLHEGQTVKSFTFNWQNCITSDFTINGYVRVCFIKTEPATQTENTDISSIEKNPISPSPQLGSDLLHLLDNITDSFSDATLVCGTTKIPVHRVILSARSPVFAAMFKTRMQEGLDGRVDIVDMEPHVLRAMLNYVYSGHTDLSPSMAGDLLFGADKYQLEELKSRCVEQLKASMAANNVFRSLVLGELHDASLKAYAVEFICKCKDFSDLEETEEWKCLMKERPSLAFEVTTALVKYLQKERNREILRIDLW